MTDLTQYIPQQSKTVSAIFAQYKKTAEAEPVRGYLGASIIGHPCERYLWYCFRQCCRPRFDGRMYRLLQTGDREEERFVNDLRMIGCEVHDCDQDGEQFAVSAFGGHFSGHMDGCALGIPEAPKTWHVLEFKTHNASSFRKLAKESVKASKPQHYAQMMIYMHLSGMKRALYLAKNKDTDDLHSERIRYDKTEAEQLMEKAHRIITISEPRNRISDRSDYYQCNWCDARQICWGGSNNEPALLVPSLSCRQCCHATPIIRESLDGKPWWHCEKQNAPISCDEICKNHLVLPGLIPFAESTDSGQDDAGNDFIEFTNKDGTTWKTGPAYGCYSSTELREIPASLLGNETMKTVKSLFGGIVTDYQEDILNRYPEHSSQTIWKGPANELLQAWSDAYAEKLVDLKPITQCTMLYYNAVELPGNRIVIAWPDEKVAEIREKGTN